LVSTSFAAGGVLEQRAANNRLEREALSVRLVVDLAHDRGVAGLHPYGIVLDGGEGATSVACVDDASRLDEHRVSFSVSDRAVLDTPAGRGSYRFVEHRRYLDAARPSLIR